MKLLLISVLTIVLSACDIDDITDIFSKAKTPNLDHFITRDDATITYKTTDGRDMFIRSNRSTITILSGSVVGRVNVDGGNNLITFEDSVIIQSLYLVGSDNVINVAASSGITIASDTGLGNLLIHY